MYFKYVFQLLVFQLGTSQHCWQLLLRMHNKLLSYQSTSNGSRTWMRLVSVGAGQRNSFMKISISSQASWTWSRRTSSVSTVRQCFSNLYKSCRRLTPNTCPNAHTHTHTCKKSCNHNMIRLSISVKNGLFFCKLSQVSPGLPKVNLLHYWARLFYGPDAFPATQWQWKIQPTHQKLM